MSEHQRSFIPFGNCVPPDGLESISPGNVAYAFQAIDSGGGAPYLLETARKACLDDCDQLVYCEEQRSEIGNELWRLGAKSAVVGAEEIALSKPAEDTDPLDIPTFRFDLSKLPQEPGQALDLLRQGVRAGQLSLIARPPKNVAIIAREYRELLASHHPDTLALINDLSDKERQRAYRYIILAICQQADFKNFSGGVRSSTPGAENRRYRPETHDFGRNYPIVQTYLSEVAAIRAMGYNKPAQVAMYYSAAYGKILHDRFSGVIKPAQFYSIVDSSISDPVGALTAFHAKLHAHRIINPNVAQSVLARRALTNRPHATSATAGRQRTKLQAAHSGLGDSAIEKAMAYSENPARSLSTIEERISEAERKYGTAHPIATPDVIKKYAKQRNGVNDLGDYITRVEALEEEFAQDPDFSGNQTLRWFAQMYPSDSRQAVRNYQKRLEVWRGWARESSSRTVPDSYLMSRAKQGDVGSYDEILKAYITNNLRMRFEARGRGKNPEAVVSTWMLNRIGALYRSDELERVAEDVSVLLGNGILTIGVAELSDFQDPLMQHSVNQITDPRSRRYLTFSAGLQALTPLQRLALAYDHNLTRLLYGAQITAVQIGGLKREDMPEGYGKDHVLPLCTDLVGQGKNEPLPFLVISQDIASLRYGFNMDKPKKEEAAQREPSEIVTIVGAGVVHLAETGLGMAGFEKILSPQQNRWLQNKINVLYPPSERRQYIQDIENALRGGRLQIRGDKPSSYHLALADTFYKTSLDDIDRAVVARVMRVDRLMYGKDLGHMLEHRLETDDLGGYLCAEILPRTGVWMDPETAARGASVSIETIKDIAEYAHTSRQWRVRGTLLAVSSDIGQYIADPQQAIIDDILRLADPTEHNAALSVVAEQLSAFELSEVRQTYAKLTEISETRRVTLRDIRRWAPEPLPPSEIPLSPAVQTVGHIETEKLATEILSILKSRHKSFLGIARRVLVGVGMSASFAEDAVNDAAMAVYERYVVRGVPLEDTSSLSGMLSNIVRNHTVNIIRKELGQDHSKKTIPIGDPLESPVYVSEAEVSEKFSQERLQPSVEDTAIRNIAGGDYSEHLLTTLTRLFLSMSEGERKAIFIRYTLKNDATTAPKRASTTPERVSTFRARQKAFNYIASALASPRVTSDPNDTTDEMTGAQAISTIEQHIAALLDGDPDPLFYRAKRSPNAQQLEEMKTRILNFLYPSTEENSGA